MGLASLCFQLILMIAGIQPGFGSIVMAQEPQNRPDTGTVLGIAKDRFTLNGEPTFLVGVSYYGGLGASEESVRRDLDDLQEFGINWLRVWATWDSFGTNVSALDADGKGREVYLQRLHRWLPNVTGAKWSSMLHSLAVGDQTGPPAASIFESYRVRRRAHCLRGWSPWHDRGSIQLRYESGPFGWSARMVPSIRRSGPRSRRSRASSAAPVRRCGIGCARPNAIRASGAA